jgi:uncharacterized protein
MDDLTTPLGQTRTREPSRGLSKALIGVVAGVLSLSLAIFIGWAIFAEDEFGGEPFAVAQVTSAVETAPTKTQAPTIQVISSATPSATQPQPPAADGRTVTIIDGSSGKRQNIVVPN